MSEKILTAEKFLYSSSSLHDMWDNTRGRGEWDHEAIAKSHIEFAKIHVQKALEAASKRNGRYFILDSYPLHNIK